MKIKYIYFDIDNTLNCKNKGNEVISNNIVLKLHYLKRNNIAIGIATTRGLIRTKDVINGLPNLPYIILNGGEIYTPSSKYFTSYPLSSKDKKLTIKFILQNIHLIEYIAFYPEKSVYGKIFSGNPIIKKSFETKYRHTLQNLDSVTENIALFNNWLNNSSTTMVEIKTNTLLNNITQNLNISYDGIYYINANKINKGLAINFLCENNVLNSQNLMVVGDANTDVSMFEIPGVTSITIGNKKLLTNYYIESPEDLICFFNQFFKL
jgi:HAD superfamily hydrolase (TIGR01484 family)